MLFEADTIGNCWDLSIFSLIRHGKMVPTERQIFSLELENVCLSVKNPLAEPRISSKYAFSDNFMHHYFDYMKEYWEAAHVRLTNYGNSNINQLKQVIDKINLEWFTRRTYLSIWDASDDATSTHPPCILGIQFLVRDGRLNATAFVRSNDAWLCAIPDMVSLIEIQREISDEIGIEIGCYTHFATSYHLYDHDFAMARNIFKDEDS